MDTHVLCCPFRQAVPGGSGFEIFEAPFLFQLTLLKVGYARWHEHDARSKSVPAGCRQEGCRQEDSAKAVLKQKADCNDRITRHEPKMFHLIPKPEEPLEACRGQESAGASGSQATASSAPSCAFSVIPRCLLYGCLPVAPNTTQQ